MNGYGDEYGVSYRTLKKIFEILHTKQSESNADRLTQLLHHRATQRASTSPSRSLKQNNNTITTTTTTATNNGTDELFIDVHAANNYGNNNDMNHVQINPDLEFEEPSFSYKIEVSMMEIYNDNVYDLLNGKADEVLEIRQAGDGTVHVPGLQQVSVTSLEDVLNVFEKGSANRATAATGLNENSSRSHSILVVDVTSINKGSTTRAKLYLVDLAGSERAGKSGVTGAAMKETQHINKSLSALGDVMEALDQKAKHIPYRNSKLTYLLQDSLGGNSRTMMIVTVCPTDITLDETLFTLGFASRVRNVSLGVARRNVNAKNLEESLKLAKNEARDSRKKRTILEEGINELKKQLKKTNEKLISLSDNKVKQVDDLKKSTDFQIIHLQKNNSELIIKLQEEKEIKNKLHSDYETLQKSFKKINDQLKDVQKERETMIHNMKLRDAEREKERERFEANGGGSSGSGGSQQHVSALARPPVRGSTGSSSASSHLGPPVRNTFSTTSFAVPSARPSRRVTSSMSQTNQSTENSSSTTNINSNLLNESFSPENVTNNNDGTIDNKTLLQSLSDHQDVPPRPTSSSGARNSTIPSLTMARVSAIKDSSAYASSSSKRSEDSKSDFGETASTSSTSRFLKKNAPSGLTSTSASSSRLSSRLSTLPTRSLNNTNNNSFMNISIDGNSTSSNNTTGMGSGTTTTSTSSTLQRTSNIAARSKEALLRHQERMEKFREKQTQDNANSKANIINK